MTEEVKGEPVSFCSSGSEYEKESAEIFTLNGYLDGRAKDFPELKLGWHGENMLFFLVSEKGFERLGIEKEIIYMEVNVKVGQEQKVKSAIRAILTEENQRRTDQGENGILLLCRSDLLKRMSDRIHGNQMILGSIGMMLLFAGLTNYFNVMIMGRYSRKQELAVMESIGMTKKQKRKSRLHISDFNIRQDGWQESVLVCWGYWLVAVVLSDGEKRFSVRNDMDR